MEKKNSQCRDLITSARTLLNEIDINYDSIIGPRTQRLVDISNQIIPIIKEDYPDIAQILMNATQKIVFRTSRVLQIPQPPYFQNVFGDFINAYSFGDIRTAIKILDSLYSNKPQNGHKIFISHSSKDKNVVSEFCDRILQLGMGLHSDDIFCTSIEDMNIKNGDDIRKHIKENILSADFSFLLISSNYKNSEICLNEMGAVWTNDHNVRYYLLPNTTFKEIGWLCDTKQAEQLIDHTTLDKLYKELTDYYNLGGRLETWSKQRVTFVDNITKGTVIKSEERNNVFSGNIDEKILKVLTSNSNLSLYDIANLLGLSEVTISKHLKQLQDSSKIESVRVARNIRWKIKS